jgi:poly(A) polymerase
VGAVAAAPGNSAPALPDAGAPKGRLDLADIDPDAIKVVRKLLAAGHEAYLVGGCVRDLYLGKPPKDFDIATSATPEQIHKTFRNSRIIGRRFRLAHVFFGQKIIETSTFRTTPQLSDEDPLITHDNEWGTVEDDARRRDFTINALFFDVEIERVVDFVDGMDDLDNAIIRTIGDPWVRFREDPVRMIRACRFASKLGFEMEARTLAALKECGPDIAKCSKARVLEELYKILRSGGAKRAIEVMVETGLFQHLWADYAAAFEDDDGGLADFAAPPHGAVQGEGADKTRDDHPAALFWRYLGALDDFVRRTQQQPPNGVLQALLFAPLVDEELTTGSRHDLDEALETVMQRPCNSMAVARRDRENARILMLAHRSMTMPDARRRRALSDAHRQVFHEALVFLGFVAEAHGGADGCDLVSWQNLAAGRVDDGGGEPGSPGPAKKRRRSKRRGGRRKRGSAGSSASAGGTPR